MGGSQMGQLYAENVEQHAFIHDSCQQYGKQGKERNDGEQDVIADAAGQQNAAITHEGGQHAPEEGTRAGQEHEHDTPRLAYLRHGSLLVPVFPA